jgi:pimeloyl-ACP methyl ester carboxylesterase
VIREASHFPHLENPEAVNGQLIRWLDENEK